MKKHLIPAVAVAALAIATSPAAHADTAKVIVNGQDITASDTTRQPVLIR
jgi:hypothetical protein